MTDDSPGGWWAGAVGAGDDSAAGVGSLLLEQEFVRGSLYVLRHAVAAHAAAAGMSEMRARDAMLAVHELAANAVRHGAGRGRLRMWSQEGALCCQVRDGGQKPSTGQAGTGDRTDAVADAAAGWPYTYGHGLWLVRLLADHMSAESGPDGTCVTVVFALR